VHFPAIRVRVFAVAAAVLAVTLASCAKPPPPPPPPPPPAPVIPMRPYPPQGASPGYVLPRVAPDGKWVTVNTGISPKQATWNMRAAFNVAALNCLRPQHAQILEGYKAFLTGHKKELLATYKKVEADFKAKHGARQGLFERDVYMTQVYNHFAFPPTLNDFCDGVLAISLESLTVKPGELDAFAARQLPMLETIFQNFYQRYAQYKIELAHWDANYGVLYGPKPVAITTTPVALPGSATTYPAPSSVTPQTPAPAPSLTVPQSAAPTTTAPAPTPQIVLPPTATTPAATIAGPQVGPTLPEATPTPAVATP
jgi:hypothetical protein